MSTAPNGELCSISEIVFICKMKWVTHNKWSSEEQLHWFGLTRPRVNLKLFYKPFECSHVFLKHSELLYATICYTFNRADKSHYPVPSPGNHEIWVLLTWSIYIQYSFKDKTFLKLPFNQTLEGNESVHCNTCGISLRFIQAEYRITWQRNFNGQFCSVLLELYGSSF